MLGSTKAVYDPVAMLSRSMGSRMEDVCATTGNDRQSDRSADHFVSPKMMANNCQNTSCKMQRGSRSHGAWYLETFRRCPAMEI